METRVATIAVLIEDARAAEKINEIFHEFSPFIISRMGFPYRAKGINIINIAVDAPLDRINALAGRLGRLEGVTAKAVYPERAPSASKEGKK